MIIVDHLSRWYGQVIGINDVSCVFGPGITALLGQNGAGKSTLIKIVTGQLKPTTGHVSLFGEHPFANTKVLAKLGYCPESDSFYEMMTGRQFVSLMARMAGIGREHVNEAVESVLVKVGMHTRADTKIAGYSKGMRQRIKLAQALVHNPQVLVLDEPLNGLDPLGRHEISTLLIEYAQQGRTVLVSSHILHEVEQMTRQIVLLHRGRLLAQGDIREIRSLIDQHPHRIRIQADSARSLAQNLISLHTVVSIKFPSHDSDVLELETASPDLFYQQAADLILETGTEIKDFYSPDNNLEAVFSYLVGK